MTIRELGLLAGCHMINQLVQRFRLAFIFLGHLVIRRTVLIFINGMALKAVVLLGQGPGPTEQLL